MDKENKQEGKQENYDKEAYQRHLCEGLNGKGCGTEKESIAQYRKVLTFEQIRQRHLTNRGD